MELQMNPVFLHTITIPTMTCITVTYNLVQQPRRRNWTEALASWLH